MATFDPSVIQDVATNINPDPAGAQAKALNLSDLYDQNTLSKIKVNETKRNQEDMTYARQILAGKDLSKLDEQNKAVAEITKRNPQLGMELARSFSQAQSDKNKLSDQQLQLYQAKNDIIGADLLQLKAKHDEIQRANPKATEQQIHDAMQQDVLQWVGRMQQAKLPDGSPLLNEQDRETIKQGLQNGYSTQWVESMVARSAQAKQAIQLQLAERKQNLGEQKEAFDEQDKTVKERQGDRRLDISEATQRLREKKADEARANFGGKNGELMAALAERGISLPAGFRSKDQQVAMLNALWARNDGLDADAIADKVRTGAIDLAAVKKETQVAAAQVGKVSLATNELVTFGDQVLEASKDLPRGSTLTLNGIMQAADNQLSDPRLLRLKVKLQALNNAYDQLAARGGTDADKRAHVHALFDSRLSDEAIQELVRSVKEEAQGAEKAAERTMRVPGSKTLPDESGAAPLPAPGAAPAAAAGAPKVISWADLPP